MLDRSWKSPGIQDPDVPPRIHSIHQDRTSFEVMSAVHRFVQKTPRLVFCVAERVYSRLNPASEEPSRVESAVHGK